MWTREGIEHNLATTVTNLRVSREQLNIYQYTVSETSATACLASQHIFSPVLFAPMRMERIPVIVNIVVQYDEMSVRFTVSP